jgi:[acyl-carrier-protein] S-malonyltransferase
MGQELAEFYPAAWQLFAQADEALGFSLSQLIAEGPAEQLNLTPYTQPAMLTTSLAYWSAWQSVGVQAEAAIGLSLGEYSALVAAGALDFATAVRLVHLRGKAMDESYPGDAGAVSVVLGLDRETVETACQAEATEDSWVQASNFNCPGQIVIAGDKAAVGRATARLQAAGAKRIIPLAVSAPFHTRLLQEAARRFEPHLQNAAWRQPQMTVVSNVDASVYSSVEQIKQLLAKQVCRPIEFARGIQTLLEAGFTHFLEIGPGSTLGGMVKKISRQAVIYQAKSIEQIADLAVKIREEIGG